MAVKFETTVYDTSGRDIARAVIDNAYCVASPEYLPTCRLDFFCHSDSIKGVYVVCEAFEGDRRLVSSVENILGGFESFSSDATYVTSFSLCAKAGKDAVKQLGEQYYDLNVFLRVEYMNDGVIQVADSAPFEPTGSNKPFKVTGKRIGPFAGAVSFSDLSGAKNILTGESVFDYFGSFVQHNSELRVSASEFIFDHRENRTVVKSASLRIGSAEPIKIDVSGSDVVIDFGKVSESGSVPWTLELTDHLGGVGSTSGVLNVLPYCAPEASGFIIDRYSVLIDDDGTQHYAAAADGENVWITFDSKVAPVAGKNTWKLRIRAKSESVDNTVEVASGADGENRSFVEDRSIYTAPVTQAETFIFSILISDWFTEHLGSEVVSNTVVSKADVIFRLEEYGIGLGMHPQKKAGEKRIEFGTRHNVYFHGKIKKLGTEWKELSLINGTTPAAYGGGVLRCRKIENKCIITGSVEVKPSSSTLALANLPEGFVPAYNVFSLNACSGSRVARVAAYSNEDINDVETRGKLALTWVWDMDDGKKYTSAAIWIQCSIEYWVEPEKENVPICGSVICGETICGTAIV